MDWWLRGARSVGIGTVAGMALLAIISSFNTGQENRIGHPDDMGWMFGAFVALLAFGYPLPSRWPVAFVVGRCLAWVLAFSVFFDAGQLLGDRLEWGPVWFNILVMAFVALAGLPLSWPKEADAPEA